MGSLCAITGTLGGTAQVTADAATPTRNYQQNKKQTSGNMSTDSAKAKMNLPRQNPETHQTHQQEKPKVRMNKHSKLHDKHEQIDTRPKYEDTKKIREK